MKIVTIVGARPQFIKASVLSYKIKHQKDVVEIIIHTGQHYDQNMSKVFFDQLGITKPKYLLDSGGMSHGAMLGYQVSEIEKILLKENPNYVVLYGDTNSTLSGALAASKLHLTIVHIEAGLRSFNMKMPEEINRILTDRLSNFLFCPSQSAVDNLINEGFKSFDSQIHIVGDIMLEGIKLFSDKLDLSNAKTFPYILFTLHRQENIDDEIRFKEIVEALNEISKTIKIVFPVHPRTKNKLYDLNLYLDENILIVEPMTYFNFLSHLKNSELVITDSGGIQKESYFMKKNCLIIREETEWVELTDNNNNKLCGYSKENIVKNFNDRFEMNLSFEKAFYGDGNSTDLILKILKDHL